MISHLFPRSQRSGRRKAAAMLMALVVLLVIGLVAGLAMRALLQSHRQARGAELLVQAELLADSAIGRAVAMLESDPGWQGETWRVSLADSGREKEEQGAADPETTGSATIRVEKLAAEPSQLRISVEAIYPNDPIRRARAEREALFPIPQGESP